MRVPSGFIVVIIWLSIGSSANSAVLSLEQSTLVLDWKIGMADISGFTVPQSPDPFGGVSVSSSTGGFSLSAGLFTVLSSGLFTGVPVISTISLNLSNATGAFSAGAGFGGSMPINGSLAVGLLGGFINLAVPLNVVGAGGVVSSQSSGLASLTLTGGTWTTGVAQITGVTTPTGNGFFVNTVTLTGYDNRTAGHRGTLQLIAPARIGIRASFLGARRRSAPTTMTLTFVPEPGTALLLGSASVAALWFGMRRRG